MDISSCSCLMLISEIKVGAELPTQLVLGLLNMQKTRFSEGLGLYRIPVCMV